MSLNYDAVLWDMDGTLVDTEPYWMATETELMACLLYTSPSPRDS